MIFATVDSVGLFILVARAGGGEKCGSECMGPSGVECK